MLILCHNLDGGFASLFTFKTCDFMMIVIFSIFFKILENIMTECIEYYVNIAHKTQI